MLNDKISIINLLYSMIENEKMGSVNYSIASYIVENIASLKYCSSTELAKQCNVSKASISRFCRNLGLEDYFDLKVLIHIYEIDMVMQEKYSFQQTSQDGIDAFLDEIQNNIKVMKETIDRSLLAEMVGYIHTCEHVYLMGTQQSAAIASSLTANLLSYSKLTICVNDYKEQKEILTKLKENDVVIVFSATGSFFERLFRNMQTLHNVKGKIYLITNVQIDYDFLTHVVRLGSKYDFASNELLYVYASLIAIEYKNRFRS